MNPLIEIVIPSIASRVVLSCRFEIVPDENSLTPDPPFDSNPVILRPLLFFVSHQSDNVMDFRVLIGVMIDNKGNGVRKVPLVPGEELGSGKVLEKVRGEGLGSGRGVRRRAERDWSFDLVVVITASSMVGVRKFPK